MGCTKEGIRTLSCKGATHPYVRLVICKVGATSDASGGEEREPATAGLCRDGRVERVGEARKLELHVLSVRVQLGGGSLVVGALHGSLRGGEQLRQHAVEVVHRREDVLATERVVRSAAARGTSSASLA